MAGNPSFFVIFLKACWFNSQSHPQKPRSSKKIDWHNYKQLEEELKEMVELLNGEVIERDKEIADMTKELRRKGNNKGKGNSGVYGEGEVETLREQIAQMSDRLQSAEQERDSYREELADSKAKHENLSDEKKQVEYQLKTTKKALDDTEKHLQENIESTRQSMRKSQEFSKLKKDFQVEQIKLFEGNILEIILAYFN